MFVNPEDWDVDFAFPNFNLALRFKRGQRKCASIRGQSCRPENNNYSQPICMSWPLSVKHAAKIAFAQYKCRTFQSIIYPADKNNFIGISSILAWGKSRVGLPPPFCCRWGYKVHLTVYIYRLGEFARHEFTNLWLTVYWKPCQKLFLFLWSE